MLNTSPLLTSLRRRTIADLPIEVTRMIVTERRGIPETPTEQDDPESPHDPWEKDLMSLSLASKQFTALCQERLFEVVYMHPAKSTLSGIKYTAKDTLSPLSKILGTSPHLAAYVRELTVVFPGLASRLGPVAKDLHDALLHMTGVRCAQFEEDDFGGCPWKYGFSSNEYIARMPDAIDSVLSRPTLRYLVLHRMTLPSSFLKTCTGLEEVELVDTKFDPDLLRKTDLPTKPLSLRHLAIAGESTFFRMLIYPDIYSRLFDFSKLNLLMVPLVKNLWNATTAQLILPKAESLRRLHLTSPEAGYSRSGQRLEPQILDHLNPKAFTTLVDLKISIGLILYDDEDVMRDPYRGYLSNPALLHLTELQTFGIEVFSNEWRRRTFTEQSFGREWGALDTLLVPEGRSRPLSKLKEVGLTFGVYDARGADGANCVFSLAKKVIFETQVPRLRELDKQDELRFIFECAARYPGKVMFL